MVRVAHDSIMSPVCLRSVATVSHFFFVFRWAFEQRNEEITKMLMQAGVPHTDRDAKGMTPVDLLEGNKE